MEERTLYPRRAYDVYVLGALRRRERDDARSSPLIGPNYDATWAVTTRNFLLPRKTAQNARGAFVRPYLLYQETCRSPTIVNLSPLYFYHARPPISRMQEELGPASGTSTSRLTAIDLFARLQGDYERQFPRTLLSQLSGSRFHDSRETSSEFTLFRTIDPRKPKPFRPVLPSKVQLLRCPILSAASILRGKHDHYYHSTTFPQVSSDDRDKQDAMTPGYKIVFNRPGVSCSAAGPLVISNDDPAAIEARGVPPWTRATYRRAGRSRRTARARLAYTLPEIDWLRPKSAFLDRSHSHSLQ